MQDGLREWTAVEDTVEGRRWQKASHIVYPLFVLFALWELWRYLTGDGTLSEFLFRAMFAVALIPVLRTRQQHMIKADTEALFLPGAFRWHRVPWSKVCEVRLDTPEPWTSAVLVTTNDGRTRKAPVVQDVASLVEYWRDVRQAETGH